jgi:hypothetical protein
MKGHRLYRVLMGTLGVAWAVLGFGLVAAFLLDQRPGAALLVPTGPIGRYFVAFTGCALIGWGSAMIGAAREPASSTSRTVGTATAFVLILMAGVRMVAWTIGDYASWLGDVPRQEATALLLVALALVWLRPTVADTMVWGATKRRRRASDRVPAEGASAEEAAAAAGIEAGR